MHALPLLAIAAIPVAFGAQSEVTGGVALETFAALSLDFASNDACQAVAVDGGIVFAAGVASSGSGRRWLVRARSAADGALLWSRDIGLGPGLFQDSAESLAISPDGATVFVAGSLADGQATRSDATVLALNSGDGSTRWLSTLSAAALGGQASALAVAPDGQQLALAGWLDTGAEDSGQRYAVWNLDANSGQERWAFAFDEDPTQPLVDRATAVAFSPDGARVVASGSYSPANLQTDFATAAFDAASGTLLWLQQRSEGQPTTGVPADLATTGTRVVVGGRRTTNSPSLPLPNTLAYDLATGAELWLVEPPTAGADEVIGVAVDGDDVLLGEGTGNSIFNSSWGASRIDGATGLRLWESTIADPQFPFASYLPADLALAPSSGLLVIAGTQTLNALSASEQLSARAVAFDAATGALLWSETWKATAISDDSASAVAIENGLVAVGGDSFVAPEGSEFTLRVRDLADGQLQWTDIESAQGPAGGRIKAGAVDPATGDLFAAGRVLGGAKGVAHLARVDGETGATLWDYLDDPGTQSLGLFEDVALSASGDVVFAVGSSGRDLLAVALDAATGALLWRRAPDGPKGLSDIFNGLELSADGATLFAIGSVDAPIFFSAPGDEQAQVVFALDATTGATRWQNIHDPTDFDERGELLAQSPDGSAIYAVGYWRDESGSSANRDLEVLRFDAASGAVQWSATYDSSPPFGGDRADTPFAAQVSADGQRLSIVGASRRSCCENGRAILWTIDAGDGALLGEIVGEMPSIDIGVRGASIAADGSRAVAVAENISNEGGVAVGFDLAAGQVSWTRDYGLTGFAYFEAVALSADGSTAYATGRIDESSSPTLGIDMATGDELWRAVFTPSGSLDLYTLFGAFGITYDDARRRVWTFSYGPQIGGDEDPLLLGYADPTLLGETQDLSLAAGGSQTLTARAGPAFAGDLYLLLGSLSGTVPGLPLGSGLSLPLNFDSYTALTLGEPGSAFLPGSFGALDGSGAADLALVVPPATNPALAGLSVHHAYVALDTGLAGLPVALASNPIEAHLIP